VRIARGDMSDDDLRGSWPATGIRYGLRCAPRLLAR
jgi:hypothetical protein